VEIDQVTQCKVGYAALDNFPGAVALEAQALRLSVEALEDDPEGHVKFLSPNCAPDHMNGQQVG
jgi:hypothetical protein